MNLKRSILKLLGTIRAMKRRLDLTAEELADLRKRVDGFDAKRDAVAVPPGSTLFNDQEMRLFRVSVTDPADGTITAKLQTIDAAGDLADDSDDTDDYTLYKPTIYTGGFAVDDIVVASFEGLKESDGTPRYYIITAPVLMTAYLSMLTGSASLATNKWKYAHSEVSPSGDSVSVKSGGRSGTTSSGYALNLSEMFHTSTYAWGVDMTGDDYPDGAVAQPVGGGGETAAHRYDVPVIMYQIVVSGALRYYFQGNGSHDGTCDA